MSSFDLQRLGQIMEPEPGNPMEVEGHVVDRDHESIWISDGDGPKAGGQE